jgi:hypothetical protein
MQNNNSGAIIMVLFGFILLGFLGYYAVDLTDKANSLEMDRQNFTKQIAELDQQKQALEKELRESNLDLQTASNEIERINSNINYVRSQLMALGLWEGLDENSKLILTNVSGGVWMPSPTPVLLPPSITQPQPPQIGMGSVLRIGFALFGIFIFGFLVFFGGKTTRHSKNVFRMKVTRKEAEVLNHLRRHRYF